MPGWGVGRACVPPATGRDGIHHEEIDINCLSTLCGAQAAGAAVADTGEQRRCPAHTEVSHAPSRSCLRLSVLGAAGAAAQERGWLAIGLESARHAFSFSGSADAVNACGTSDCEVVETFTACLAVAYWSETASGRPVWTWTEAATEGDANRGAQDECEAAGGLAWTVMNTYCLDGGSAAARQATPPATAEQETVFWQSIVESENPADFEAYLRRFPNGVFSDLAQNRLAAMRVSAGSPPAEAGSSAGGVDGPARGTAGADVHPSQGALFRPDQTCAGQPAGSACWQEISRQPGCFVWNPNRRSGALVTWSGECGGGFAQGMGTLEWDWDGGSQTNTGRMRDGRRVGTWILRSEDGSVQEGQVVDGVPNGHWVLRFADGGVEEGPLVDGERNGHWVIRDADGTVGEGPFVNGARNGNWLIRFADGTVEDRRYQDGDLISREPQ